MQRVGLKREVGQKAAQTRARILRKAVALFNRYGVDKVTISRLAQSLNISPGNLTYYFKRKRDLLQAVIEVLQEELRSELKPQAFSNAVKSPRQASDYVLVVLRTFWSFRFVFNSLSQFATVDSRLRTQYFELREWVLGSMQEDLDYLCQSGYFISPEHPNSFKLLAENIWSLWSNWLRVTQFQHPAMTHLENEPLYDGALHHWSLCQPLMERSFAQEMLKIYQDLLLPVTSDRG